MRESSGRLSEQLQALKEARARRAERRRMEAENPIGEDGPLLTEDDLREIAPILIRNPRQRFRALYLQNNWTEEGLREQLSAVKRTKWTAIVLALVSFIAAFGFMALASVWVMVLVTPCLLVACVAGIASAVKYAIYQAQIEERECLSGLDYLSRPDLFSHFFS